MSRADYDRFLRVILREKGYKDVLDYPQPSASLKKPSFRIETSFEPLESRSATSEKIKLSSDKKKPKKGQRSPRLEGRPVMKCKLEREKRIPSSPRGGGVQGETGVRLVMPATKKRIEARREKALNAAK